MAAVQSRTCQSRRAAAVAALGAVAALLTGCQQFFVEMTWTCANFNTTANMCLEWVEEGGVSPPSCFPGDATVITRTGPKRMDALRLGEDVLGFNHDTGHTEFSAVRAWLHRDIGAEVLMRDVQTAAGSFAASSKHLLATGSELGEISYQFADQLQAGHSLRAANGSTVSVRSVERAVRRGLYAPLTWSSNYFVGGPSLNTSILAHSFAQVSNPRRYEGLWHFLLSVTELFAPAVHQVSSEAYIHPVARISMRLSGAPLQGIYLKGRISTQGDEGLVFEDDAAAAERRLRGYGGYQPQYGHYNGQYHHYNGQGAREQQNLAVVMAVIKTLPPFISQAEVNSSTGVSARMADYDLGMAKEVEEWTEKEKTMSKLWIIISAGIPICCACFCICGIFFGAKKATRGDSLFHVSDSEESSEGAE